MSDDRPAIPADTQFIVRTRSGHQCSVDGVTSALEFAHIIDWAESHDHSPENLLLLCANCHTRSHKEKWSRKTLRYYRDHPFVTRGDARAYRPTRLPYPSLGPLFKGREDFLIDLRTSLEASPAAAIRGHTVHGMGGVGKTRAAVEYAWRFAGEYEALLFVEADSPEALSRNLATLCATIALNLPQQHEPEQAKQEQSVMRWLQTHPGWLLIIDNADTKEALVAVEGRLAQLRDGHVIITTRRTNCSGSFESLDLDVLAQEDAADFLLARTEGHRTTTSDDEVLALELAGHLGGLALALEQAAAYIRELRLSFADYVTRWLSVSTEALAWHDEATMHYPRSLAITYQTSIDQLSDPAREFFRVLSWFAPDPIPFFALDSEHAPDCARALLAELENLSLARRNEDGSSFAVHRLIQEITRQQALALVGLAPEYRYGLVADHPDANSPHDESAQTHPYPSALATALTWIAIIFPCRTDDVRTWSFAEPLVPHVRAIALHAAAHRIIEPTTHLLNCAALLYKKKAQYSVAEPLYRYALAIDDDCFGSEHPNVAGHLNNLAALLEATGRYEEAEPLYRRALVINETAFGPNHTSVAFNLNNLAHLLQATNRLAQAEPLMRRALDIDEATLGSDHPNVARDLNNLGTLLQATGRLAEAEPLMRRAIAIDQAATGLAHPDVARDIMNLASLLLATDRGAEGEPLMRQALAIDEAAFGSIHPEVAVDLCNLALLLKRTQQFAEAEQLMRRALAINEAALGSDHPDVARDITNLATLLQATNRLAEAEPLMRRALVIDEVTLGCTHPKVARDLDNLALLLQAANRLAEAEPLIRRALDINETVLGKDHFTVAARLNNLAQLLMATNRLAEAEPLIRRAIAILKASFGENHPQFAVTLNNLAQLLQATNRLAEAEPIMRRVVAILIGLFGENHSQVAIALNNLALLLQATNRVEEAEPLIRQSLSITEAVLGNTHPDFAVACNNLAQFLQDANRLTEAEPLMRHALAITKAAFGESHPKVAIRLNNLARLLQATNQLEEAEPLMWQALGIWEDSLGANHPQVATGLNNLAILMCDTNRLVEAKPLMGRQLDILVEFTHVTGHPHPHLEGARRNYFALLVKTGASHAQAAAEIDKILDPIRGIIS